MKKIAFFDIDGTLTSEIDGSLPKSAINAIRHARTFGHLMFINTDRKSTRLNSSHPLSSRMPSSA